MKYKLTITQTIDTSLEPIADFQGNVIGFKLDANLGGGEFKPNVCFEVMDNNRIVDGTDVSKQDELLALGIDDLNLDDFTREFETIPVEDSCGNGLTKGDTIRFYENGGYVEGIYQGTLLGSEAKIATVLVKGIPKHARLAFVTFVEHEGEGCYTCDGCGAEVTLKGSLCDRCYAKIT